MSKGLTKGDSHNGYYCLKRYSVFADGVLIGRYFDDGKAAKACFDYEYSCMNQDIPCYPNMSIVEEILEGDHVEYNL